MPGGFATRDCLRILGVDFYQESPALKNWNRMLDRVSKRLAVWRARPLSMSRRVLVIKADVLPQLNHLAYVFPIPFLVGRRLERAIFSFIWGCKVEWVDRATMFLPIAEGGREVPCLPLKLMCLYTAFQARVVAGEFG